MNTQKLEKPSVFITTMQIKSDVRDSLKQFKRELSAVKRKDYSMDDAIVFLIQNHPPLQTS